MSVLAVLLLLLLSAVSAAVAKTVEMIKARFRDALSRYIFTTTGRGLYARSASVIFTLLVTAASSVYYYYQVAINSSYLLLLGGNLFIRTRGNKSALYQDSIRNFYFFFLFSGGPFSTVMSLPRNASARPSRNYLRVLFFSPYFSKETFVIFFQSAGKTLIFKQQFRKTQISTHTHTHTNKGGKYDIVTYFFLLFLETKLPLFII